MDRTEEIDVEVAYATPGEQRLLKVRAPSGITIRTAIECSGLLREFPEIDLNRIKVGIFSRRTQLTTVLRAGDRIEIYRPLAVDPMTARRARTKRR